MSEQFKHLLGIILIMVFLSWFFVYTLPFGEMVGKVQAISAYANMEFECKTELIRKKHN